jgi:hypothetical protein
MLAVIVGGAVITVRQYQVATSKMEKHATLSSEIQTADLNGSVAAMTLQRYVLAGNRPASLSFRLVLAPQYRRLTGPMSSPPKSTLHPATRSKS